MIVCTKPFTGEIKELLDLAYARNLPDALGGYLLTPIDSLPRSALQEAADELRSSDTTAQDITKMLQRKLFEFVQEGRYLPSLDLLSLPDVHQIRGMSEWNDYNEQLLWLVRKLYHSLCALLLETSLVNVQTKGCLIA